MAASSDPTGPFDLSGMVVEVTHVFDARIEDVWALLTDVERMAGLGPEHHSAAWTSREDEGHPTDGDGVVVGDRFVGSNRRGDFEWDVMCHIIEWQPPFCCSWTVLEPEHPSSTWSYELTAQGTRTRVVQSFRHGPGPSFVRQSVERDPGLADTIITGRSEMLRTNMTDTLRAAERVLGRDDPTGPTGNVDR